MINQLEIKIIEHKKDNLKFDFFIDEIELDKTLGINRLTDMRFCDFDLDIFNSDKLKFTDYERKTIVRKKINELIGIEKPFNQFQTDRVVLYRCHCGCDYCGIISFVIEFSNDYIFWKNIRFELDDETETKDVKSIEKLQFNKKQYSEELNKFISKYSI